MTTLDRAVPQTETKEKPTPWRWVRRAAAAVVAPALLAFAVIADAAVFARIEEESDGFR
jgi:hypothetical protein